MIVARMKVVLLMPGGSSGELQHSVRTNRPAVQEAGLRRGSQTPVEGEQYEQEPELHRGEVNMHHRAAGAHPHKGGPMKPQVGREEPGWPEGQGISCFREFMHRLFKLIFMELPILCRAIKQVKEIISGSDVL